MRAIRVERFGDPEVLTLREVPDPSPGPGEVLVRIRAAGVNPVETYIRGGQYAALPNLPYIPGGDGAGDVAALGSDVSGISVGDRVWVRGGATYAELTVVPAGRVHPLPDGVPYEAGAALGVPYLTAYRALFIAGRGTPGDHILVHGGSGGVGLAALQLARMAGLLAVGTASTDAGLKLIREQDATAITHDAYEEALSFTGGRGFDVIVENAAHLSLGKALSLLAVGGRMAVVGSRAPVEMNPRDLMAREASIVGVMTGYTTPEEASRIARVLFEGLTSGAIRPHIRERFPLKDAPKAHRAVMEPGAQGKIVLVADP